MAGDFDNHVQQTGRIYPDLRYMFIRGLLHHERYQRTKSWLKSSSEWTSRAIVSLDLSDHPIKSIKQASKLEAIGGELSHKLNDIIKEGMYSKQPPAPGVCVSSGSAILLAMLKAQEETQKSESGDSRLEILIPESRVRQYASAICEEKFLNTDASPNPALCPAMWRINVLINRGWIKKRQQNKLPVYQLLPAGQQVALRMRHIINQQAAPKKKLNNISEQTHSQGAAAEPERDLQQRALYTNDNGRDGIILMVDTQEWGGDRVGLGQLANLIKSAGIQFRTKKLPVGDYSWLWRKSGKVYMLPVLMERKRADDFARSMRDGRYENQKLKMLQWKQLFNTGQHVTLFYLVEGDPRKYVVKCADGCGALVMCGYPTVPQILKEIKSLKTNPDFKVKLTEDIRSTVKLLANITADLKRRVDSKEFDLKKPGESGPAKEATEELRSHEKSNQDVLKPAVTTSGGSSQYPDRSHDVGANTTKISKDVTGLHNVLPNALDTRPNVTISQCVLSCTNVTTQGVDNSHGMISHNAPDVVRPNDVLSNAIDTSRDVVFSTQTESNSQVMNQRVTEQNTAPSTANIAKHSSSSQPSSVKCHSSSNSTGFTSTATPSISLDSETKVQPQVIPIVDLSSPSLLNTVQPSQAYVTQGNVTAKSSSTIVNEKNNLTNDKIKKNRRSREILNVPCGGADDFFYLQQYYGIIPFASTDTCSERESSSKQTKTKSCSTGMSGKTSEKRQDHPAETVYSQNTSTVSIDKETLSTKSSPSDVSDVQKESEAHEIMRSCIDAPLAGANKADAMSCAPLRSSTNSESRLSNDCQKESEAGEPEVMRSCVDTPLGGANKAAAMSCIPLESSANSEPSRLSNDWHDPRVTCYKDKGAFVDDLLFNNLVQTDKDISLSDKNEYRPQLDLSFTDDTVIILPDQSDVHGPVFVENTVPTDYRMERKRRYISSELPSFSDDDEKEEAFLGKENRSMGKPSEITQAVSNGPSPHKRPALMVSKAADMNSSSNTCRSLAHGKKYIGPQLKFTPNAKFVNSMPENIKPDHTRSYRSTKIGEIKKCATESFGSKNSEEIIPASSDFSDRFFESSDDDESLPEINITTCSVSSRKDKPSDTHIQCRNDPFSVVTPRTEIPPAKKFTDQSLVKPSTSRLDSSSVFSDVPVYDVQPSTSQCEANVRPDERENVNTVLAVLPHLDELTVVRKLRLYEGNVEFVVSILLDESFI